MPEEAGRRRYPRFAIHVPFLYAPQTPWPTCLGAGWTRSLSEGGATVEVSGRLRPGIPLRLLINAGHVPIEIEAQAVWNGGRSTDVGGLVHGLTFTQITSDQVLILREIFRPPAVKRHAGIRIPLDVPVTCHPRNPGGPPLHGRTGNVSRSGLFLRLPQLLLPATSLEVTLCASKNAIAVGGSVVWVEPPEIWKPGESIGHGFRFAAIDWPTLLSLGLLVLELP